MVELTGLDARCYVCGHLISGPITLHTDRGQAHPSCVNCSPYAEARIAELEAENKRLTKETESYRDIAARKSNQVADMIRAEALSRTGAVKVLEAELDWYSRTENGALDGIPYPHVAHVIRVMLSRLTTEPAAPEGWNRVIEDDGSEYLDPPKGWLSQELSAPEGQQEPVAYIKDVLRIFGKGCTNAGPTSPFGGNPADCDECLTAAAMSLSTRPSEQAVTEAMVEAAWNDWQTGKQEYGPEAIRSALKAAMEAGR